MPTGFLRPAGREAVLGAGSTERRTWEAATLLAVRDWLRAGDIWVEGSRQWQAIEDQLIPPALFAAMREAGPLPVAAPATAEEYWAERRALLERCLAEVNAKDRWTGFSCAFIHLHTGLPATDPRVVLTAVLADATNLGLTPTLFI